MGIGDYQESKIFILDEKPKINNSSSDNDPSLTTDAMKFHHMRHIVAVFGFVAFFLLSLHQDFERISMRQYHQHYDIYSPAPRYLIRIAGFIIMGCVGFYSKRLSAKRIMLAVMLIHAIHAGLHMFLYVNDYMLVLTIFSTLASVTTPSICIIAMHAIISKWSPPNERSFMTSTVYCGASLGAAYIRTCSNDIACGLYIAGLSIVWIIFWWYTVEDSPDQEIEHVTLYEKNFIRTSIESYLPRPNANKGLSLKKIISSQTFTSLALVGCSNVAITVVLEELFRFTIGGWEGGRAEDYFIQTISALVYGFCTMKCLDGKTKSFDFVRKAPALLAILGPLPLLILIISFRSYDLHDMLKFTIYFLVGAKYSGIFANIIDISPDEAPRLMAVVLMINEIFMAILYHTIVFVSSHFSTYETLRIIIPICAFNINAAVHYWREEESTQQIGEHSSSTNSTAGEISSTQPAPPLPLKV